MSRNDAPALQLGCSIHAMGDEASEAGRADRQGEAIHKSIGLTSGAQWGGPLLGSGGDLAGEEPEEFWQRLIAQLEAEADQVRAHPPPEPGPTR